MGRAALCAGSGSLWPDVFAPAAGPPGLMLSIPAAIPNFSSSGQSDALSFFEMASASSTGAEDGGVFTAPGDAGMIVDFVSGFARRLWPGRVLSGRLIDAGKPKFAGGHGRVCVCIPRRKRPRTAGFADLSSVRYPAEPHLAAPLS